MNRFNPIIEVKDDGLNIPEVRQWSLEKYKLVGSYCDIFTTGMKGKWNQLVYLDLFAGSGYSRIKESGKVFLASPLIAMSIPNIFSKYILCEEDKEKYNSLRARIDRDYSHLNVEILNVNSNKSINKIRSVIPPFRKGNTMLPFCFVDPYSLNLLFNTIKELGSNINMDFLILQALHMDGNRNFSKYLKDENERIGEYLDNQNWRDDFNRDCNGNKSKFVKFLADQYTARMKLLHYIPENNMHQIRSNDKNLPLYYLAFYSKHPRGIDYYKRIEKYSNQQYQIEFD